MTEDFGLNKKLEELKLLPDSVYKNLQMGKVFIELDNESEAISYFEKVIIEEPYNLEALEEILKIYNNTYSKYFNSQKAGEIAERIASIDKNNSVARQILYNSTSNNQVVIDSYNESGILDVIHFVRRIDYLGLIAFAGNVIILFIIIGILLMPVFYRNNDNRIRNIQNVPENSEEIFINPLSDMDGYSKKDVFDIRKWYVFRSMFSSSGYTPSEDVFGRVQDGKYWYGTNHFVCFNGKNGTKYRAEGDSFLSTWLNNPSYLLAVDTPYAYNIEDDDGYEVCTDKNMLFIPQSINYNKELNMITVNLKINKTVTNADKLYYMLIGVNAIDLGYKWGYVFNTQNITFRNQNTAINRRPYQFRDFIAVCGLTPNCNHLCSVQHDLEFTFDTNNNALIDVKLWKERPTNIMSQPDIYYRLIFDYEKTNR